MGVNYGLEAPCHLCGYDGPGYWQTGTHKGQCIWHTIGGRSERALRLLPSLKSLSAEVARLTEALRDFGRHRDACEWRVRWDAEGEPISQGGRCTCGLAAALAVEPAPPQANAGSIPAAEFDRLAERPHDDPAGDLTPHLDDRHARRPGREQ